MNNWRLLLLAIVAVFQPIASFTERNLVDGRQQCCDRLSSVPLRETLHGLQRLAKTPPALRRLNERTEIQEDRRHDLERSSVFSRPSTERLVNSVETRKTRTAPTRSFRVGYRVERHGIYQNRDRLLDVHEREQNTDNIRGIKIQDSTRRVVDRISKDDLDYRQNNYYRAQRSGNERQSKTLIDSQREIKREQSRNGELRYALDGNIRLDHRPFVYMNNLQRSSTEMNTGRYQSSDRADTGRFIDNNNERRDVERNSQRLVYRIRDRRILLNSRVNRQTTAKQRVTTERFDERRELRDDRRELRQRNKVNTDRRISNERPERQNERDVEDTRRDSTRNNRVTINIRNVVSDQRLSRERIQIDRTTPEFMNARNKRANRREVKHSDRMLSESRNKMREDREHRISTERAADISRDARENHDNRLSRERTQIDRRDLHDFRVETDIVVRDYRRIVSRRDMRDNDRVSRFTREENRLNPDKKLSLTLGRARVNIERSNTRDFKGTRDISNERQTRNMERSTERTESIQKARRDIREFKGINNIESRRQNDIESLRAIRYETRSSRNNAKPQHQLAREKIQMERPNTRDSRMVKPLDERDLDSSRETEYNVRFSRHTRDEIRENSDRKLGRESRRTKQGDIRESSSHAATRHNERNMDDRREIRDERLARQIRDNQSTTRNRQESRSIDRVTENRRARSVDRRDYREIRAEPRLSRSFDNSRSEVLRSRDEVTNKIENREREAIEAHFRDTETSINSERINSIVVPKMETEDDSFVGNWQYVLYTLQTAYLCGLFMQMLTPSLPGKPRKMNLRWLPTSSSYNPIKVD